MVQTPRKTTGPISDDIGGHKRTTGEAGIATTGVFRELDWDYSQWKFKTFDKPFGFFVFKPSGCDSRRFNSVV